MDFMVAHPPAIDIVSVSGGYDVEKAIFIVELALGSLRVNPETGERGAMTFALYLDTNQEDENRAGNWP